ncbi:hypothetical protein RD110_19830 [Rhodoferax koreense]|uniref:Fumarylacetoacetase-like C-terminal domain-containing protein n=1 Tax=Rhodoferax koreensis TaxID=1842727 RepID=A0A1P8JZL3_9BURK|nr:fumarylacetoacetate hydrolase family protein [Rhodoferax koreense]APW39187.1 hypothetical protein RD110_19830 [Rhodoferax koreense]
MTLSARNQAIVDHLLEARRSNQPWPAPFDETPSTEDAYAIQAAVGEALGWFPEGAKAWKVGGKGPISAAALPEVLQSPAAWATTGPDEVVIEAELALRLARTPTGPQDVAACIGTVCVSIEIVGTRLVGGLTAPPAWKLCDQGLHAGLVIGAEQPFAPYAAYTLEDWARQPCQLLVNGQLVKETKGTHPTGDPLSGMPGLTEHAARYTGGLRAGDLVTTGAWIIEKVRPGDKVEVRFEGFGKAVVQLSS